MQPSKLPNFKSGDIVRSRFELVVDHAPKSISYLVGSDPADPHRLLYSEEPVDSTPIRGLTVRAGVLFMIDAVLPWDDENDPHPQRYRLELTTFPESSTFDEAQALTNREVDSLRVILGATAETLPFYLYGGEADLELVTPIDGREPGSAFLDLWEDDDMFPWSVTLIFPAPDDLLKYAIDSDVWEDDEDDDQGYFLFLHPLFFARIGEEPLLTFKLRPGYSFGRHRPYIDFAARGKAAYDLDFEEHSITIHLHFGIAFDFEQKTWTLIPEL